MQLDSSPLRAADITPDLRKQFAFLSGDAFILPSHVLLFTSHHAPPAIVLKFPLAVCTAQLNCFIRAFAICYSNVASVVFLFTVGPDTRGLGAASAAVRASLLSPHLYKNSPLCKRPCGCSSVRKPFCRQRSETMTVHLLLL